MASQFELCFRDQRKLANFVKTCEAMIFHSDTALFKVRRGAVYLKLTDFESFCCLETRMTENLHHMLKMSCPKYSVKILLDSLTNILRKILKNKHTAVLFATEECPLTLQVKELQSAGKIVESFKVESTEHRPRVYRLLSTNQFKLKSQDYIQFRMPIIEFNKIITAQSILSGSNGGVGELSITPIEDEIDSPPGRCQVKFFLSNHSGAQGGIIMHSFIGAESVPLQYVPKIPITLKYFITYLKRSQNLFSIPSEMVTIFISDRGILIQTDSRDNLYSIVIFTPNIADIDLDSLS